MLKKIHKYKVIYYIELFIQVFSQTFCPVYSLNSEFQEKNSYPRQSLRRWWQGDLPGHHWVFRHFQKQLSWTKPALQLLPFMSHLVQYPHIQMVLEKVTPGTPAQMKAACAAHLWLVAEGWWRCCTTPPRCDLLSSCVWPCHHLGTCQCHPSLCKRGGFPLYGQPILFMLHLHL